VSISISPIGYLIIPLGLVLFFKSRRQLFWATVAAIPFFYTYVVDLSVTLVQPYQYFGMLLILRNVVDASGSRSRQTYSISVTAAAALGFLLACYLSLLMPAVLRGAVYVVPMDTAYQEYENVELLRFTIRNLLQVVYPTFMVFFFLSLAKEIRDLRDLKNIARLSIVTAFVIIGFGFVQQLGIVTGVQPLVEVVFRLVTGFEDVSRIYSTYNMIGPLPRMFSLVGEPGFTASYLVFVFAMVLALKYNVVRTGWKTKHDNLAQLFLLFGLIMTGSTTAYLGLSLLVIVLIVLPRFLRLGKTRARRRAALRFATFFAVTAAIILLAAPVLLETSYLDYVYKTHYAKMFLQEGSGNVRLLTAQTGVQVFLKSPILGVGYGSHRTTSLLTSLLSNVGAVGTLAFLLLNVLVFRRGLRACRRSSNEEVVALSYALLASLATLLPTMLIAKSMIALIQGWYWLLLAMLEGCYRVYRWEAVTTRDDEHAPVADGYPAIAG